jgi:hypothetical protein
MHEDVGTLDAEDPVLNGVQCAEVQHEDAHQNRISIQRMNFMGGKYTSFTLVLDRYRVGLGSRDSAVSTVKIVSLRVLLVLFSPQAKSNHKIFTAGNTLPKLSKLTRSRIRERLDLE